MADKNDPSPKRSLMTILLDLLGVSDQRQLSLGKFFGWFKQPSNLLSLAAILAVVIVPWIEKLVRSDEELRAKIDTLLETTNKVIAMNQQRMSTSGSDVFGNAILVAQRENELAKASAIAESIKHDVYPAVLFALSNELCASGKFEEAHTYLREVMKRGVGIHFLSKRPSNDELSQAHVVSAHCYTDQSQTGGIADAEHRKLADDEMSEAVAILGHDQSDRTLGQVAITYTEWAEADERMGDTKQAQSHRQTVGEIAKKMRFADPTLTAIIGRTAPADPPPPPALKEDNLPRSAEGDTYLVTFPDDPDETAALILPHPDTHEHYDVSGVLYFYHRTLFTEADEVDGFTTLKGKPGPIRISFQKTIPTRSMSGNVPKIELLWTIEDLDKDRITGVQSKVGRPPHRFVARLSISHQNNPASGTRAALPLTP